MQTGLHYAWITHGFHTVLPLYSIHLHVEFLYPYIDSILLNTWIAQVEAQGLSPPLVQDWETDSPVVIIIIIIISLSSSSLSWSSFYHHLCCYDLKYPASFNCLGLMQQFLLVAHFDFGFIALVFFEFSAFWLNCCLSGLGLTFGLSHSDMMATEAIWMMMMINQVKWKLFEWGRWLTSSTL